MMIVSSVTPCGEVALAVVEVEEARPPRRRRLRRCASLSSAGLVVPTAAAGGGDQASTASSATGRANDVGSDHGCSPCFDSGVHRRRWLRRVAHESPAVTRRHWASRRGPPAQRRRPSRRAQSPPTNPPGRTSMSTMSSPPKMTLGQLGVDVRGPLGHEHDEERAEDGPQDRGGAADDQRGEELDGAADRELLRGRRGSSTAVLHDEQRTAEAGEHGADPERQDLVAGEVDAEHLGGDLAVPDGDEGTADPAADQVADEHEDDDREGEEHVVDPLVLGEAVRGPAGGRSRAPGCRRCRRSRRCTSAGSAGTAWPGPG